MCNPVAVMAVATIVSAGAQIKQGEDANAIARFNAQRGEQAAKDAEVRGALAEEQQLAKVRQIRGTQLAAMGASGLDANTGTMAKVQDQTTSLGKFDAETIKSNAAREAWGYRSQATSDLMQGQATQSAGYMGAAGTLLAGGARAYGLYQDGQTRKGVK